uniref:Uncharacterized protein n=1 Tax=Oryza nivara TaxID=4536 RepID=A0A0E0HXZ7_ORYNI
MGSTPCTWPPPAVTSPPHLVASSRDLAAPRSAASSRDLATALGRLQLRPRRRVWPPPATTSPPH